jgi:hypothetical protein
MSDAAQLGMTDEEASKEICPFIRFCVNEVDVIQDGRAPIYVHQNCQGSACRTAWRLMPRAPFRELYGAPMSVSVMAAPVPGPQRGYCGIAGKPEGK